MTESINFQLPENGFGNYVKAILPPDQAVLAGAFASSMMQIKNIQNVNFETFAQVVYSIETNNGLPLINGSNVPVDTFLVNQALSKIALGSDLYGTYNMSNFIGSVTGLPYPLGQIYDLIRALETENLYNIYDNIYLAVNWEQATATPVMSGLDLIGFTITNSGGGYGREGAVAPTVSISNGGTATVVIGTDPTDLNTYGKVTDIVLTNAGSAGAAPTVQIQAPPLTDAGIPGVNSPFGTVGWPGMNAIIDNYCISADNEISRIQNRNAQSFEASQVLNTYWNITGIALKTEQRSRYAAIPPVAIPYFKWLTPYPLALINFIETIPTIADDTCPNGPAQSVENMVDLCEPGGQSIIGLMREQRNMQRLITAGLEQDNTISDEIPEDIDSQQCVNGTVPGAVEGIPSPLGEFTLPSWPEVKTCDGEPLSPTPTTYYDPNFLGIRRVEANPDTIGQPPLITGGGKPAYNPGNVNVILNITPENLPPTIIDNTGEIIPEYPVGDPIGNDIPVIIVNPNVPVGDSTPLGPPGIPIADLPFFPTGNVLPFTLNSNYTNSTLLPSQYDVASAIDKVIECNCDCWVN